MTVKENHKSIASDTCDKDRMESCCRRIVSFMETERRYLRTNYSIWELSRDVGIFAKFISHSINSYMQRNFFELLNRMRVEEAKRILRMGSVAGKQTKNEGGARECGFNSRYSFLTRFNEYEGITPVKYMNLYKTNSNH